jgi:hypothetical protein
MDERHRDVEIDRGRSASRPNDQNQGESEDDLTRRREQAGGRPPLTRRERDERWPVG